MRLLIDPSRRLHCLQVKLQTLFSPSLWPPNSSDLNLVDYKIWAVMQETVHKQKICDVDELRERIIKSWDHLNQSIIDSAISQWRTRLQARVRENGKHFQHRL